MRTTMWVGGAELAGQGEVEVVANPATEEPLAEVPSASPDQVDRAGSRPGPPWVAGGAPRPASGASCCTGSRPGFAPTPTSWAG